MPRPPAPGRFVVRMLDEATAPVFALDGKRQIVFANRALGEWLAIDAEQLLGQRCDYATGGDDPLAAACAALCPPPEAFAGQVIDGSVSRLATGQHAFERRPARFLHIAGNNAEDALLLVLIQPQGGVDF